VPVFIHPKEFTVQAADHPQMTDDDAAAAAETDQATAPTLDELQLPISFELDTARISLAALAGMRPGYAVELDVPLREATVRLVCHGQTLGQGQLVAIGGQLGVRITRMEHTHAPVAHEADA
jgi:type III secretion protein Q